MCELQSDPVPTPFSFDILKNCSLMYLFSTFKLLFINVNTGGDLKKKSFF